MLHRHDLVYLSSAAWRSLLDRRDDLSAEPLLVDWVDRGWPLVARRPAPDETAGLALGLPLPPSAGRRRVAVVMRSENIVGHKSPLRLREVIAAAPEAWKPTLVRIEELAARHGVEARVFGSLGWRSLTGLDYLTAQSDLDLLLTLPGNGSCARLAADLGQIESAAPVRLDGEFVRPDGAAVNWRELHAGARQVLVKAMAGVELIDAVEFLQGAGVS
jgi:phosphoribosyl-dephospho-CoA transferase